MASEANRVFKSYAQRADLLSPSVWLVLRLASFSVMCGLIWFLIVDPIIGLKLFWFVIIPILPTILVLAPGLWRQVCPMAFANQIPRQLGLGWGLTLPTWLQKKSYLIAIFLFVGAIAVRKPLLEVYPLILAPLLILILSMAFWGGMIFKGRSGWCGTLCPLGPIQRVYGQAPVVVVKNGYCKTCVGCQTNCYDFNPEAAVFNDIEHADPAHANQRRFFVAMLPGLITAFFLQGHGSSYGYIAYLGVLFGSALASAVIYYILQRVLKNHAYRLSVVFAGLALVIFYYFAAPNILYTLTDVTGYKFASVLNKLSPYYGIGLGAVLLMMGLWNEHKLRKVENERSSGPFSLNPALAQAVSAQFTPVQAAQAAHLHHHNLQQNPTVIDVQTGHAYAVSQGQSLLDVLEGQGHDLKACCRTGMCGADPVLIIEGMDNLSPPTLEEEMTLKRLGLDGHGRMACSCKVLKGSVKVNRDVSAGVLAATGAQSHLDKQPAQTTLLLFPKKSSIKLPPERLTFLSRYTALEPMRYDYATRLDKTSSELARVVIIGNGIAGITAAEELRRLRKDVEIIVITQEDHSFYNRMALNKIFEGHSDIQGLVMGQIADYARKGIQVKIKTHVASIDRANKSVKLAGGQTILYDKLILATGATPALPKPGFQKHQNTFVLRTAQDAAEIKDYILDFGLQDAVIIGGGVLGVEAAEAFARLGAKVTIIHRCDRLMERQLDDEASKRLAWYLEDLGVTLVMNTEIADYDGYRHLMSVNLTDGRQISGDIFVACVGTVPNKTLAQQIGLRTANGIIVNRYMKTSDQHIYAIGDVAELQGEASGLWAIGMGHAQVAAASIVGQPLPYEAPRNFMRLKSEGILLFTFGNIADISSDFEVLNSSPDAHNAWRVVLQGEQVRGAVFAGLIGAVNPLDGLLGSREERLKTIAQLRLIAFYDFASEPENHPQNHSPVMSISNIQLQQTAAPHQEILDNQNIIIKRESNNLDPVFTSWPMIELGSSIKPDAQA